VTRLGSLDACPFAQWKPPVEPHHQVVSRSGLLNPCLASLGFMDPRPECGAAGPANGNSHRVVDVHELEEGELREGRFCGGNSEQMRGGEGRIVRRRGLGERSVGPNQSSKRDCFQDAAYLEKEPDGQAEIPC